MSYFTDSLGIEDKDASVGPADYLNKSYRGPKHKVKDIEWKNTVRDAVKAIEGFSASIVGYIPKDVGFNIVKVKNRDK